MFDKLLSSRTRRDLTPGRGVMVAAVHGALIMGAIRATATGPIEPLAGPIIKTIVFDGPRTHEPADGPSGSASSDPVVQAPDPLAPPAHLPTTLPPITDGPHLDPDRLRRIIGGGPGPVRGDSLLPGSVRSQAEVDQPAEAVHQPEPRYPPVLQHAGIQGRVLIEFVIDTLGHTQPASLRVLESSNPGFEAAAFETLRRSVFRPARVQGRPVRQRTVQAVAFRITH